jgi:hypothetical protein
MSGLLPVKHESIMWVTPLSDDKTRYFATVKEAGHDFIMLSYTYDGKIIKVPPGRAFVTIDSFSSLPNYGMSYYFATVQGKLKDGNTIGLLLQDGIGS